MKELITSTYNEFKFENFIIMNETEKMIIFNMKKFLIVSLIVLFQNCQVNGNSNRLQSESLEDFSFVVSCGSGCALTYNTSDVEKKNESVLIRFKVEMFVNEEPTDVHFERYQFQTHPQNIIFDETGLELSSEAHPSLVNNLYKVFNHL